MEYRYASSATGIASTRQIPVPFTLIPTIVVSENGGESYSSSIMCLLTVICLENRYIWLYPVLSTIYASYRTYNRRAISRGRCDRCELYCFFGSILGFQSQNPGMIPFWMCRCQYLICYEGTELGDTKGSSGLLPYSAWHFLSTVSRAEFSESTINVILINVIIQDTKEPSIQGFPNNLWHKPTHFLLSQGGPTSSLTWKLQTLQRRTE